MLEFRSRHLKTVTGSKMLEMYIGYLQWSPWASHYYDGDDSEYWEISNSSLNFACESAYTDRISLVDYYNTLYICAFSGLAFDSGTPDWSCCRQWRNLVQGQGTRLTVAHKLGCWAVDLTLNPVWAISSNFTPDAQLCDVLDLGHSIKSLIEFQIQVE